MLHDAPYHRWVIAGVLLRLPAFMIPLGFVLLGSRLGSTGTGGLMVAAETLGMALGAPLFGRIVDQMGPKKALMWLAYAVTVLFLVLLVMAQRHAPAWLLVAAAGSIGVLSSPRNPGLRALLNNVVPETSRRLALSLNATIAEAAVLCGPLIVGAAALASAQGVLLAMAAATFVGGIALRSVALLPRPAAHAAALPRASVKRRRAPLLRSREFWFWLAAYAAFGQIFGTVETGALPWALTTHSGTWGAATGLAILSAVGIVSNLLFTKTVSRWRISYAAQAAWLLGVMAGGLGILALAHSWSVGAAGMAVIGAAAVPMIGLAPHAAGDTVAAQRQAEGFGILSATQSVSYALGGVWLAILPVHSMLLLGGALAVLVIVLAPVWHRFTPPRPVNLGA